MTTPSPQLWGILVRHRIVPRLTDRRELRRYELEMIAGRGRTWWMRQIRVGAALVDQMTKLARERGVEMLP